MELKLKQKYLAGGKSRFTGGRSGNNKPAKQKHQLTDRDKALHAAQPRKMMVMSPNGKIKMVTV